MPIFIKLGEHYLLVLFLHNIDSFWSAIISFLHFVFPSWQRMFRTTLSSWFQTFRMQI